MTSFSRKAMLVLGTMLMVMLATAAGAEPASAAAAKSAGGDSKDVHETAKSKVAAMQASVKSASAPAHPAAVPELHTAAPAAAPAAEPKAAAAANDGFGKINMGNMGGMGGLMGSMMPGRGGGGDGKGNKGGTYGVMKKVGAEFGLGSLVGKNQKDPHAKPVGKAILDDLKAKHPEKAWGNALFIVGAIGTTVITLTAVGTYFIAKAENKRLKKAKKNSNLLGGRYGAAKNEADSDDEQEKPVYEPMTMRDMV